MGSLAPTFFKPENITGIRDFLVYINRLSGNLFLPGFLMALWVILFSLGHQRTGNAMNGLQLASWAVFVLTGLFVAADMIDKSYTIMAVLMLGLAGYATLKVKKT